MKVFNSVAVQKAPWNKGKLVGEKPPLRLKEIWAIRIRLQLAKRARELALLISHWTASFVGCDLVSLRVGDGDVRQGVEADLTAALLREQATLEVQRPAFEELAEALLGVRRLLGLLDQALPHVLRDLLGRLVKAPEAAVDPASVGEAFGAAEHSSAKFAAQQTDACKVTRRFGVPKQAKDLLVRDDLRVILPVVAGQPGAQRLVVKGL